MELLSCGTRSQRDLVSTNPIIIVSILYSQLLYHKPQTSFNRDQGGP